MRPEPRHMLRGVLRRGIDTILLAHTDAQGRQSRPYGRMAAAVLDMLDRWHARLHLPLIDAMERRGEGRSILRLRTEDWKRSDTVCILGSGPGINRITPEEWRHIAACDSIGVNFWPVHDHVPSILFFEVSGDAERNAVHAGLMRMRADAYAQVPVCVNIRDAGRALEAWPAELRRRWHLYATVYGAKSVPLLRRALERLAAAEARGEDVRPLLVNHSGSMSTMVLVAMLAGHRRIELWGVDPGSTTYFWEEPGAVSADVPLPPNTQRGEVHSSMDPRNPNSLTLTTFLDVLATVPFVNRGCEIIIRTTSGGGGE